jgi:type I restriction enzyme R subunit
MQAIARVNRVFGDKPNGLVVDYIGIAGFLAEATKKYTGSGGEGAPTIDLNAAVRLCLLQLDEVKAMMGGFDQQMLEAMSAGDKMQWTKDVVNDLMKTDASTDRFLIEERKLTELVAMTSSDSRIWEIEEEVIVAQKIRQNIRKIKFPPGQQRAKNERIRDLISQSLASSKIIDLAEMYDLENINISIIDDRFQAIVKEKGEENIKIQLLRRIINDELNISGHKNQQKTKKLKEALDKILSDYHKNSMDSIATIKHLLDMSKQMQDEERRKKELGLSDDELAFYDLLATNEKILNQAGPVQDLVHRVVNSVKKNLQLDWTKKEDAKAAIRLAVRRELKGKVPFSELDQLLKKVVEQAEGQYKEWPEVG